MRMPLLLAMLPKRQSKCRDPVKVPRAASARRSWNYNGTAKRCELDAAERPMNAFRPIRGRSDCGSSGTKLPVLGDRRVRLRERWSWRADFRHLVERAAVLALVNDGACRPQEEHDAVLLCCTRAANRRVWLRGALLFRRGHNWSTVVAVRDDDTEVRGSDNHWVTPNSRP